MTAEQLRAYFNAAYGLGEWPETYEVDAETYEHVRREIYKRLDDGIDDNIILVSIGPHGGIRFKGVELIVTS